MEIILYCCTRRVRDLAANYRGDRYSEFKQTLWHVRRVVAVTPPRYTSAFIAVSRVRFRWPYSRASTTVRH